MNVKGNLNVNDNIYSGGTNLLDIFLTSNDGNTYTTGSTVVGDTVYFDRTDALSAYTADLSSIAQDYDPRVSSVASTATLTVDSSLYDQAIVTAQAAALTIAAPTGSPVQGRKLIIRIKDNATARALTWNAIFRVIGVTLPTTTVISKTMYIGCIYNSTDTKWDVVAVVEEA